MPIFTNPISSQNQAGTAGVYGYPAIGSVKQYVIFSDEFYRESLNPTNGVALYTTAVTGAGTNNISATGGALLMKTTTTLNDNNSVRSSGVSFARVAYSIDNRNQINATFSFAAIQATSIQCFVGLLLSSSALTGLPTTTRHLGIYLDTSVSNNWKISSANGATQTTTDTGSAVSAGQNVQIQISWTGNDTATITFYTASNTTGQYVLTNVKSQTVTSLGNGGFYNSGYEAHFFTQTLTIAQRELDITEWKISAV